MKKIVTLILAVVFLAVVSITEPFIFTKAQAGWGPTEQSCQGPDWYWQGNSCQPDATGQEIFVYGTQSFDTTFFQLYILPMYSLGVEDYQYLPVAGNSRIEELQRRKRIHDCEVQNIAAGMRQAVPGLTTQTEVTFEYQGVRARFDIVESQGGIPIGIVEVKTVLDYEGQNDDLLVRNQPTVAVGIRNGQAVPVGGNAIAAGFNVGFPVGRSLPFTVVPFPVTRNCETA
ncbi:hypothetical protein [Sphingomonas sp. PP-CC-3G-468]|uniref:hypothetical protein n=1 Tax=Sphingomonas sp. PP-CC-3G-468 TaxID=2135656 RepID=UPI00104B64CD|nr:hypothetical protein [Sphingomonas sp. PP-CC-3G-468]TCM00251.1 hypothetical protein C8J41_12412 [Sphingomonas sp. PP-CC-3G-468]